jgi:hypothetical protein
MPADAGKVLTVNPANGVPIWTPPTGGSGGPPTGTAGGDLTGTYPAPSIGVIQNSNLKLVRGEFFWAPVGASVAINDPSHDNLYLSGNVSWALDLWNGLGSDEVNIARRPAGAPTTYVSLLTVRADGRIRVTQDPLDVLDLATKRYVDAHAGGGSGGAPSGPAGGDLGGSHLQQILKASGQFTVANGLTVTG